MGFYWAFYFWETSQLTHLLYDYVKRTQLRLAYVKTPLSLIHQKGGVFKVEECDVSIRFFERILHSICSNKYNIQMVFIGVCSI